MNITCPTTAEAVATAIRCRLPIRYLDEEDTREMMAAWPGWGGAATVEVVLEFDTGKVRGWPEGRSADLYLKVVDEGCYYLLGPHGEVHASLENDYVPGCVPGEYGDYVNLQVGPDGVVRNWRPRESDIVESFWPEDR